MIIDPIIITIIVIIISFIVFLYFKSKYNQSPIKLEEPKSSQYIIYSKCIEENKKLKILSYNILAQEFMKRKDIKLLTLDNRLNSILKEISFEDPDIFCLQEVTNSSFGPFIQKNFQDQYDFVTIKNYSSSLMNVTGFRINRFELKNKYKFDLSNENVTGNRGIIYTLLSDKQTNNNIALYNVHFPWRPIYDNEKGYILLKIFNHILSKPKEPHVIIAGDFNSLINSLVVRMVYYKAFLKELKGDYNNDVNDSFEFKKSEIDLIEEINRHIKRKKNFKERLIALMNTCKQIYDVHYMRSAYEKHCNLIHTDNVFAYLRNHPKYTNYTMNFKATIDYILYSKFFKLLKIRKINESKDYLPNLQFPSDHCKLYAEFEIL